VKVAESRILKKEKQIVYLLIVLAALAGLGAVAGIGMDKAPSLRDKAQKVQMGIRSWAQKGKDPRQPLALLQQAKSAFDRGDAASGESCLDKALLLLGRDAADQAPLTKNSLPVFAATEKSSHLFDHPQKVVINGYQDDCMEPFISRDGKWLFFNNSNAKDTSTHIHYAQRVDENTFNYIGLLKGAQSSTKDMAPTMDDKKNIVFTSLRTFPIDGKSLFVGKFDGKAVSAPVCLAGDIWPTKPEMPPFWIDMDCDISPDGKTLVISRALLELGADVPSQSDLIMCTLTNGRYVVNPDSEHILKSVNTPALEYAPSVTNDGLELYFTRTSQPNKTGAARLRIMVARRDSVAEPFAEPEALTAIDGFVEAPTLSLDGTELFFHKKDGARFQIYRAVRQGKQ